MVDKSHIELSRVRLTERDLFCLERVHTISYPASWWDAIKARLGLAHNRKRHVIDAKLLFPDIDVPGQRALLYVRTIGDPIDDSSLSRPE